MLFALLMIACETSGDDCQVYVIDYNLTERDCNEMNPPLPEGFDPAAFALTYYTCKPMGGN